MGFLFWRRKKEEKQEKVSKEEYEKLKNIVGKVTEWIKHLHKRDGHHELSMQAFDSRLSNVESELEEIKSMISFFGPRIFKQQPRQQTAVYKQTAVQGVQTPVQTGVQMAFREGFLRNLSMMERAIVWVLINTDMKLSYEDIAILLGKSTATIRGQINAIKHKQEGLIQEIIEKNGKKRVFISDNIKQMLLKTIKLRKAKKTKSE